MADEKKRILIIEDNIDLNEMYKIVFQASGYIVEACLEGITGITKAAEFQPDVILLDIMMPQMNGYEVLEALRKNTSLDTLVVVNSNLEQEKDITKAQDMGAIMYLKKSQFTPSETVSKVEEFLSMSKDQTESMKTQNHKHKILIVEDLPDLNEAYRRAFQAEHFEVTITSRELDAITKAVEFHPDVILIDVLMPNTGGFETITDIRQNTSIHVPIVINSDIARPEDQEKINTMQISAVYPKSKNPPEVLAKKVKALIS